MKSPPSAHTMPHPSLFLVLVAPYGLVSGFVIVTLAYQLTQRGLGAGSVGELIALSFLPQTWKVLWAPLVDTLSTRKRWYVGSALACAVFGLLMPGMLANAASLHMAWLGAMVAAGSIASSTLAMTIENFMAAIVPDEQRGRAAGWYQAGCLGGSGLGGGLALWLIQSAHWSATAAGAALAAICVVCCLALRYVPDPPSPERRHESLLAHAREIGWDLWSLARSRAGALALLVCFLPISSGAASNLWAAVAGDWHASADTVALVNGALSGVVSVAGCLVAGWICDRMDRRVAYCFFGVLQVAVALAMAWSDRTTTQFVVWTTAYAFVTGLTYAGFSAVVLDAIGRTAGATKYNLIASLANMPIAWMTLIEGYSNDRWGSRGMLLMEAAIAASAIVVFVTVAGATRRRDAQGALVKGSVSP